MAERKRNKVSKTLKPVQCIPSGRKEQKKLTDQQCQTANNRHRIKAETLQTMPMPYLKKTFSKPEKIKKS